MNPLLQRDPPRFSAFYFDGQSARRHTVEAIVDSSGTLLLRGESLEQTFAPGSYRIDSRLGNTRRVIRLPGDARCETDDHEAVDRLAAAGLHPSKVSWLHRLETSWRLALAAMIAVVITGWLSIQFGIPIVARAAAFAIPDEVDSRLGRDVLASLDRMIFEPTALQESRRAELDGKFSDLLSRLEDSRTYRLEFRSSPRLGPNAFALPNGAIVLTDELVALCEDDRLLLAVLLHECGHIRERHGLRMFLQNASIFVALSLITGDISSFTALSATLPAFLLQTKFSRDFEREADRYAIRRLRAAGLDPGHLADALELLHADRPRHGSSALHYLDTHPVPEERVQAIRGGDEKGE